MKITNISRSFSAPPKVWQYFDIWTDSVIFADESVKSRCLAKIVKGVQGLLEHTEVPNLPEENVLFQLWQEKHNPTPQEVEQPGLVEFEGEQLGEV
jgi:hypothetical protein